MEDGLGWEQSGSEWDGETADGIGACPGRAGEKSGPRGFQEVQWAGPKERSGMSSGPAAFKMGVKLSPSSLRRLPATNAAEMLRVPVGAQGSNHLLRE